MTLKDMPVQVPIAAGVVLGIVLIYSYVAEILPMDEVDAKGTVWSLTGKGWHGNQGKVTIIYPFTACRL